MPLVLLVVPAARAVRAGCCAVTGADMPAAAGRAKRCCCCCSHVRLMPIVVLLLHRPPGEDILAMAGKAELPLPASGLLSEEAPLRGVEVQLPGVRDGAEGRGLRGGGDGGRYSQWERPLVGSVEDQLPGVGIEPGEERAKS